MTTAVPATEVSPGALPSASSSSANVFNILVDKLCADDVSKAYLGSGNITIDEDYVCNEKITARTDAGKEPSFVLTADNMKEFRTIIFGEMGSKEAGTKMGPAGNYTFGGDKNFIDDNSSVRHVYQLFCPANCPEIIRIAWNNQVDEIKKITDAVVSRVKTPDVRGILTPVALNDVAIRIASLPVYVKGSSAIEDLPTPAKTERIKLNAQSKAAFIPDAIATPNVMAASQIVASDKTYPCACFDGYKPPFFKHKHSEILQHEVYCMDNKLVAPWNAHKVLKPNVLVLMEGIFHVWKPHKPNSDTFKAHVMQFIAHSIKVIGTSDSPYELPDLPSSQDPSLNASSLRATVKRKQPEAFDVFTSQHTSAPLEDDVNVNSPAKRLRPHVIIDKKVKKASDSK